MKRAAMPRVIFSDTRGGIAASVKECLEGLGGAHELLKSSGDVYIKINAIDLKKYCYTDPEVLRETIRYFKNRGAHDVYVMENCTQGNFTRLVFKATGIAGVCRETGAKPVYLDETGAVPVFLESIEGFIDISDFVYERLVIGRDKNLYISLPKLKTHSMSQVTLSIKNQFGLVHQGSRIADHNYRLHKKFADIYGIIRPDVALIDGTIATNHGHYVAEGNSTRCIVPMNLLIAGTDPLAADTAAAELMGFTKGTVEHLRHCAATGIGQGDMRRIEIVNKNLFNERKKKLSCELLEDFPGDLTILRGRERCCKEGCRRNTETVIEVLHRDHGGKGGFTVLMGKGVDPEKASKIEGRVHIAGSCAIGEYGPEMTRRLGKKSVTMSPGCNNLAQTIHGLCIQMKVPPLRLVPVNPLISLMTLMIAKMKGSRAIIPPLF